MKKIAAIFVFMLFSFSAFCAYRTAYDLASFMPGVPAGDAIIRLPVVRPIILPVGLPQTVCTARVAATASTVVTLKKVTAGVPTNIGTLTWAAAATICNISFTVEIDFVDGDILEEAFPTSPDATLADITIGLAGIRP